MHIKPIRTTLTGNKRWDAAVASERRSPVQSWLPAEAVAITNSQLLMQLETANSYSNICLYI